MEDATPITRSWMDSAARNRFWSKVEKNGPFPDSSDPLVSAPQTRCWVWTAAFSLNGYGQFPPNRRRGIRGTAVVSRLSYMEAHSGIQANLDVDHLCRNRACVNPEHLEAVSRLTNQLRGATLVSAKAGQSHCINGHAFSAANTRFEGTRRRCRECNRIRVARDRARRKAEVNVDRP